MDSLKIQETRIQALGPVIRFHAPASCKVYTPLELATAMISGLGISSDGVWLEPSFGRAVFLRALKNLGVARDRVVAIDVDRRPTPFDELAISLRGTEFLGWAGHHQSCFDRIIGNPPYVAIERLNSRLQSLAASVSWGSIKPIGLNGNLWAAFLVRCLRLMRPGGCMSFVLPAAWDYADYAEGLRRELPKYFSRLVIHRCEDVLFSEVQDGCVVLQAFGFGGAKSETIRFQYSSAADLRSGLADGSLQSRRTNTNTVQFDFPSCARITADSVFNVRLGGVTGDAKFFLLKESVRKKLNIPVSACRPVLSRARHLVKAFANKQMWKSFRGEDERVWLFDPKSSQARLTAIRRYLQLPATEGGCNRKADWVGRRKPWYRVRIPKRIHGFVSGTSSRGPWICLNAMPRLAATNTLYVVEFKDLDSSRDKRAAWCLSLLTSDVQTQLQKIARVYAGGMKKFEPADLLSLKLPVPFKYSGASAEYSRAIKMLVSGDCEGAMQLADRHFELIGKPTAL
jgi:adenine-specific DNA-methyltransferase